MHVRTQRKRGLVCTTAQLRNPQPHCQRLTKQRPPQNRCFPSRIAEVGLSYQWFFGGSVIEGATTNSYTVTNAQPTNAGPYYVVVTNSAGSGTSVVATLKVMITVTVTTIPAGAGRVDRLPPPEAGDLYGSGTVVTLTATANPGYVFSEWSGDASGSTNPVPLTVNGNRAVMATFRPFIPGGATELGLATMVPDAILYDTSGCPNLDNWEPSASVLGNHTFLIAANTFAEGTTNRQRFALAFQPVAGGNPTLGEAFFADNGTPFREPVNASHQNGNPGRVAGDRRPGAVYFIAGGEASPHRYAGFQSDGRWGLGFARSGLGASGGGPEPTEGRYATVQVHALDSANRVQTMRCKAQDSANGRLTSGTPPDADITRFGGELVALDNGNFVAVVHDRSRVRNPSGDATVATIFAPSGAVVRESLVVENRDLWSNVAAYRGGFAVRVHENLYFYDRAGNLVRLASILASGMGWDTGRGDGHRIGAHINSPYIYMAGWVNETDAMSQPIRVVRLGVWDSRTGAFVGQCRVSEMSVNTIERVNVAVDALDRVCVVYEAKPTTQFPQYQVVARVVRWDGTRFESLTPSFFPFVNYDPDGLHNLRSVRPSVAMTTRQICIAAKGELNRTNNPLAGADSLAQSTFYTVITHPAPQADPTPAAQYALNLTVSPVGAGTITISPPLGLNGKYAPGTVVTLTASPHFGFAFGGWEGAAGTNPTTLTMDADKTVTANFILDPASRPGFRRQIYTNIPGAAVGDLTSHWKYPNAPDITDAIPTLESQWLANSAGDNYGQRLTGWLVPPSSGDYRFYLASDDAAQLFLSTDESPENRWLVVEETGWNAWRNWEGEAAVHPITNQFTGQPFAQRVSPPIALLANHYYYMEVLHKEGPGGDFVSVAWKLPGAAAPLNWSDPIGDNSLAYRTDLEVPLTAALGSGSLILTWDPAAGGFTLEAAGSLEPPIYWIPVPSVSNNQVTLPVEGGSRFYRLRK